MNSNNTISQSNNRTKEATAAAIPIVGAIVTAALLLSGLSLISSYQQPVIAQTDGNATNATAAGNVTNATAAGNVTNATTTGNATNMTTAGGPTAGEGEGSGGGAAGGGGTTPSY
jgi:hypothetical protein